MSKKSIIVGVLAVLLVGLGVLLAYRSILHSGRKASVKSDPQPNLAYLSILQSNQLLAKVGIAEIHGTDVRDSLQMEFHGQTLHSSLSPQDLSLKIAAVLDRLVEEELLDQLARRQGMTTSLPGPQGRQDLVNRLLQAEASQQPPVSDREIREFYKNHGEKFYIPPGSQVRELFLPVQSSLYGKRRKQEVDKNWKLAETLVAQVRQGQSLEALAKVHVPEAFRERAAGYLFKGGTMKEEDESAILHSKPGEVVGPVRIEGGVSVFQCVSQERARFIPFYQAQDKIKAFLETQRTDKLRSILVSRALKSIQVQRFTPDAPTTKSGKS